MDLTTFYSQFRDETAENLRVMNDGLMALEQSPDEDARRELIAAIFRAMHTIKGSARLLGLEQISQIAHTCEHILGAVREGRRELDRALTDDLMRGGDAILEFVGAMVDGRQVNINVEQLTRTLGRGLPKTDDGATPDAQISPTAPAEPAPAETQPVPAPAPEPVAPLEPMPAAPTGRGARASRQTIRVRVDRLDRLLNLAGELTIGSQVQSMHLETLHELEMLVRQQERALVALDNELKRMRFSPTQREAINRHINGALNTGEQAQEMIHGTIERFSQHAGQSTQLVQDLEQEVMVARLLPVSTVFSNLPRAVRELARELSKEVALIINGETTEFDRKVIEALSDPLTHLLRNALDHGIERPEERAQAGKSRQGTLTIEARALGSFAQITISDDGRGMDPKKLRAAGIRKGLLTPEAATLLSDQEAIDLVFMPGFSTAAMITDISGRGVGMDVVRTNIVELGGQVHIDSHLGKGTTVTLVLPLTLVTTRVILVEAGEQLFGLPASTCHGIVWVNPAQVRTVEGRAMLPRTEGLTPLLRLDELLEIGAARHVPHMRRTPAILIGATNRPIAIIVDRLADEREVVVKPLGPLMEKQRRYSGAMQLGDGRLALLLNPATLAQMTRGMALAAPPSRSDQEQRPIRLLVADDSFATRELIRSILSSAGYDVTTAVDGWDALDKLRANPYDLVVSDVEMPRVDGFQLTARIRTELGKTDLPVIIITSLASETHRRRGLEAGAQAYIVKSQFNQNNLIETIRQLLGS